MSRVSLFKRGVGRTQVNRGKPQLASSSKTYSRRALLGGMVGVMSAFALVSRPRRGFGQRAAPLQWSWRPFVAFGMSGAILGVIGSMAWEGFAQWQARSRPKGHVPSLGEQVTDLGRVLGVGCLVFLVLGAAMVAALTFILAD